MIFPADKPLATRSSETAASSCTFSASRDPSTVTRDADFFFSQSIWARSFSAGAGGSSPTTTTASPIRSAFS